MWFAINLVLGIFGFQSNRKDRLRWKSSSAHSLEPSETLFVRVKILRKKVGVPIVLISRSVLDTGNKVSFKLILDLMCFSICKVGIVQILNSLSGETFYIHFLVG